MNGPGSTDPRNRCAHAGPWQHGGRLYTKARLPGPSRFQGRTRLLTINNIPIEDTFAEAFPMTAARLIVTAETAGWAQTAGQVVTGYASSVIGCDVEAGVERILSPGDTA